MFPANPFINKIRMDYVKKNQDAFTSGAIAVVLGLLGKMVFKKDILPTKSGKEILITFLTVSAAGIGANELKSKYPIT